MRRILVTGASGFVGRHLCALLTTRGFDVVGTLQSQSLGSNSLDYRVVKIGDMGGSPNWRPMLTGIDCVVHLAARVHIMNETAEESESKFHNVNATGTAVLANSAAECGVQRFVFMSSVKVLGENTKAVPFSSSSQALPVDPYARSKRAAEDILDSIAEESGLEVAVLRPPLVYGPSVRGNFLRMLQLAKSGVPLPLAGINNLRSMVSVSNLCDAIHLSISSRDAIGQKLLVADGQDISTPGLMRLMRDFMGIPNRLFPLPQGVLGLAASLAGRRAEFSRLSESLQVDIEETKKVLGWSPRVSLEDGVRETVEWFLNERFHSSG